MTLPRRTLQVFPDAPRRQAALRAARSQAGLVRGDSFLAWDGFLEALGGARELGRRMGSPLQARAVVASLAPGLGDTGLGDFIHEPAFARAALEVVLDLKAGRLSPRELQDALEVLPPERRQRTRMLALLYHAYEQKMAGLGLADREDGVRGSREALERGVWPSAWEDVGELVIHGLYDVRPSTLELLMSLASACAARRVDLRVETPVGGSPVADAALAALFRAFENRGESLPHVDLFKADLTFESRPMLELGRHLFSPEPREEPLAVEGLHLWSAGSARDEARLIARDVRRRVGEGVAPEHIAVAWRDLGSEAGWVADALAELGVPVRLPWGEPLARVGPVRLALDLPLLVEDGFPAERVAELVSSRYAPWLSRGSPQAPATLLSLAAVRDDRLGAVRGKGAYDVRLEALARRLEPLPSQVRPKETQRAYEARVLRERCLLLIESCRLIPEQGKASELLAAWWRVVGRLGLMDSESTWEAEGDEGLGALALEARSRDDAARRALAARVRELERALAAVGGGPRLKRRTFGRWLVDAMQDVHLPARGSVTGAVEVLDVRELEGRTFEHVFLGGLAEGRFPGREAPNPLLGDSERHALNKHLGRDVFRLTGGEFEERAPWRLTEDRLLFASALAAGGQSVSLSFSVEGVGGQEQAPSAFLEEVRRLTGRSWEARALPAIVPLDEVLTSGELRQRVVLESQPPLLERLRVSAPDPARHVLRQRFAQAPWLVTAHEMVQVEIERLHFFGDTRRLAGRHTGAVDDPALAEAVREMFRFGAEKPLSASALARFGNCGFQGFVSYGLKVPEPEQPGEDFDRRGQGVFWHRVLEEFFKRLKERHLLGREHDALPEGLLDSVLDEVRADFEARHYVGHPALWRLARERAKNMVRRILLDERRGLPFEQLEPEGFELRFGPRNPAEGWGEVTLQVGEEVIHFEGTIDRLDVGHGQMGVIDYKSGKLSATELSEKLLESDFQLPLYLHAARVSGHRETHQAAWFSLRTGQVVHLSEVLAKNELDLDELLSTDPEVRARLKTEQRPNLTNAVETLVRTVRAGQFAMRPKDCGNCGYQSVCRITERRLVDEGSHE